MGVTEAQDVDGSYVDALAGWRHAREGSGSGPGDPAPDYHLVADRDDIFGVKTKVHERAHHHLEKALGAFFRRVLTRGRIVLQ